MTTASEKTTRIAEALAKLTDQFKGQVNIEAIISACVNQSQQLEAAAFDVIENTLVATAEGAQLDGLGAVVGVERGGFSDADYRIRIAARILQNQASGTIPELLELCTTLGAVTPVLTEQQPAAFSIITDSPTLSGREIGQVVSETKPAGVRAWFIWHESTNPFRFGVSGQGFDQGELAESLEA